MGWKTSPPASLVLVGALALAGPIAAAPVTTRLSALADTTLRQQQANQNRGDDEQIRLGWSQGSRALVRFDHAAVAAAVGSGTLVSAHLELWVEGTGENWNGSQNVGAHRVTTAWTEKGATWNCAIDTKPGNNRADCNPPWNGGDFVAQATATVAHAKQTRGRVRFEVTADVAAFLAGTANQGWLLKKANEGQSGRVDYTSREGEEDEEDDAVPVGHDGGDDGVGPRLALVVEPGGPVDTTPPTVAVVSPAGPIAATTIGAPIAIAITIADTGSGVDPSSVVVRYDGAPLAGCSVTATAASCTVGATAGAHRIEVALRDRAGNAGSGGIEFGVVLDLLPPVVAIRTPAAGSSFSLPVLDATFPDAPLVAAVYSDPDSAIDPSQVRLLFDGVDVTTAAQVGPSGLAYRPTAAPADGEHRIEVTVGDHAGRVAQTSSTFVLDSVPPTVTLVRPAPVVTADSSPIVEVAFADGGTGIDPASVRIFLDNTDLTLDCTIDASGALCPSPVLADGRHSIAASALDRAGNLGGGGGSFDIVFDREPPTVAIVAPQALAQGDSTPMIRIEYTDVGSGVDPALLHVFVDGAPVVGCAIGPDAATCEAPPLARGAHTVRAEITDRSANRAIAERAFDVILPVAVSFSAPTDGRVIGAPVVSVAGRVSPGASVRVNGISATVTDDRFEIASFGLHDGINNLIAVADDGAGNLGTAAIQVTADTVPPTLSLSYPADGATVSVAAIPVIGLVNDLTVGTVNDSEVMVTVNGTPASIANRGFSLDAVPLALGENRIALRAVDHAGNSAVLEAVVTRIDRTGNRRLLGVAGDGQTATVSSPLPAPLAVRAIDAAGLPLAGAPVVFRVVAGDGTFADGTRAIQATTDALGEARAAWTLGSRAGVGVNRVRATAPGIVGDVLFSARATAGAAAAIHVAAGDDQRGAVGAGLPLPLVAVVFDVDDNPVPGVEVTFRTRAGGGTFGGAPSVAVITDASGRAETRFLLGSEIGLDNHRVEATFPGLPNLPAVWKASGLLPGDPAATSIVGVVLDNQSDPVPGVTVRLRDTAIASATDANGRFRLAGVPVGRVFLIADATTATRPGTWASLEFELFTLPGVENTLPKPVYVLPLDVAEGALVDETRGGTVTISEVPGFALEIAPGSVTFPGGGRSGIISATAVHADKIPMSPGAGMQPRLIVTIQPAGALFDPPARLTLPNVDGLAAGKVTELFSFDHEIGAFVSIGTGVVSEDGLSVTSEPGFGVQKAGWHCGTPPSGSGQAATLSMTIDLPDPIFLAVPAQGQPPKKKTVTAAGGPPADATYTWATTDAGIVSLVPSGSGLCPNASSCPTEATPGHEGEAVITATLTCTTTGNTASALRRVIVGKATIQEVYSEQIGGRECNMLPPKANPGQNKPMLMGAVSGGTATISVKAQITPAAAEPKARVGVRKAGDTTILGDAKARNGKSDPVSFSATPAGDDSGGNLYEAVVGIDMDGDGKLQAGEVQDVYPDKVRVVTTGDLARAKATVQYRRDYYFAAFATAQGLVDVFLGTSPTVAGATTGSVGIGSTATGLTHPLGASWNTACMANIPEFTFTPTSAASQAVAASDQVEQLIKAELNNHKAAVQAFFAAPGAPSSATFPAALGSGPWTWSGSSGNINAWITDGNPDIGAAFGTVGFTDGKITRVDVEKTFFGNLNVTRIVYEGRFSDLYDFDYTKDICRPQAIVQATYPTLGAAGRIFNSIVTFTRDNTPGTFTGFSYRFN